MEYRLEDMLRSYYGLGLLVLADLVQNGKVRRVGDKLVDGPDFEEGGIVWFPEGPFTLHKDVMHGVEQGDTGMTATVVTLLLREDIRPLPNLIPDKVCNG